MRVRAIESKGSALTKGKVYEVIESRHQGDNPNGELLYYIRCDTGSKDGFFAWRFEIVETVPGPRKPKPQVCPEVWREKPEVDSTDYMGAVRAMCGEGKKE